MRTNSLQGSAQLKGAHRARRVLVKLEKNGLGSDDMLEYGNERKTVVFISLAAVSYLQVAQSGQQGFCLFAAQTGAPFSLKQR